MASFSPYANLILYNDTDDKLVRFLDFRTKIAGPNIDSNFMKIDTILDNQNTAIESIEDSINDFIKKSGSSDIAGSLIPINDSTISIGSENKKWLKVCAANIVGSLNNSLIINGEIYNNSESKNINLTPDNIGAIPINGSDKVNGNITPLVDNGVILGSENKRWANLYSSYFTGELKGNATTSTNATNHISQELNAHTPEAVGSLSTSGGVVRGTLSISTDSDPTLQILGQYGVKTSVDGDFYFGRNHNLVGRGICYSVGYGEIMYLKTNGHVNVMSPGTGLNIYMPIRASAFTPSSSMRYKDNIKSLTLEKAKKILDFRAVEYDLKSEDINGNATKGQHAYGFIAEEVDVIDNTYVHYDNENRPEALDYMEMVAPMKILINDLYNRVFTLEQKG